LLDSLLQEINNLKKWLHDNIMFNVDAVNLTTIEV